MHQQYNHGIIIGKFMPLHVGHEALIDFARKNCQSLTVCVCSNRQEEIPGILRYQRLTQNYGNNRDMTILHITDEIPRNNRSLEIVSGLRAQYLLDHVKAADVLISSENYGEIMAKYMAIDHLYFDKERDSIPISGTQIRENPKKYEKYLNIYSRAYFSKLLH